MRRPPIADNAVRQAAGRANHARSIERHGFRCLDGSAYGGTTRPADLGPRDAEVSRRSADEAWARAASAALRYLLC